MGVSHIGAVRAARLFNPNNQIVVVLSNRSGLLTAEHTGWVKDYRAVLLTMESLEATAFTAADWRGIMHLQDLWPSVHSTKEGKRRPPLGYYTRYAYLAAAWRTLRLDSALHIELDVILTATLSELCAATGWPDAYGRARLDATAAMHVRVKNSMERCPAPTSYGSVHASFMNAEYVAAYWREVVRYNYLRKGADSGGDMRITGVLREKGMCTAATLTHSLPPSACGVSKACLHGLLAQNIIIPACAYAERNLTRAEGDAMPRGGANLMPYYAPPEEPMTIRIKHLDGGLATIKSRVLVMATPNGAHGRALYLHFHAHAKQRTLGFLKCFFLERPCQTNFVIR